MKLGISRIATTGLAACAAMLLLPSVSLADHRDRDDRHRRGHGHEREYRAPVHKHGPACADRHDFRRGHRGHDFRYRGHDVRRGHYYGPRHSYRHPHPRKHLRRHLGWWFRW